ncbi:MAG TPA: BamA/TamA family outer membrane protein [Fibrobacteraceae bacterium]|nr:BamA/TamA family outer membrane protein [Fibrobacteraceae bacterium]
MRRFCAIFLIGFSVVFPEGADSEFQRFGLVPVAGYAEETGWQFGAMGMIFFHPIGPRDPGSQLDVMAMATTRGQKRIVLDPTMAFWKGRLRAELELQRLIWPAYYWGGGNSPTDSSLRYDMDTWRAELDLQMNLSWLQFGPAWLRERVAPGVLLDLESNRTSFSEPDSLSLATHATDFPTKPDHQAGWRSGLGWSLQWDSRDHDNWPRSGMLVRAQQLFYAKVIGSSWNFSDLQGDFRLFLPTPLQGAWGMAAFWEGVQGTVPFDRLPAPDGTYHLRGLEKGRFRDRQQLVLQGEWRVPLFWRFSAAAFAEAGKVGPWFSRLMSNDLHTAFGAGGRFTLNQHRKLNVRGDLAWVDGGIGMSVYYREAF